MSLISFPTQIQIIPYTGPPKPKPKQTSRRSPSKTAFNGDEHLALDDDLSIGLTPASHQARDVDSTSTGSNICKLEDFGSRCGDISCTGGFPPPGKQGAEFERLVSTSYLEDVLRRGSCLPTFEDSSQERIIVIEDSESESNANNNDGGYFHYSKSSTQPYDGFGVADFSTEDKTEDKENAISSELVEGPESQANGLPRCEPTLLIPPTGSSTMQIGESMQGSRGDTLPEATTDQSQEPVHKKAEVKNKYTPLVTTSSCGGSNISDSDDDDNDDSTNSTRRTRKRKCSLLSTQDCDDSRGRRPRSDKQLKSGHRSPRQARKPDRGGANENEEYEVEMILKVRCYCDELQYRVQWLGYKTDRKWYYASGFKNSPRKLREFHNANPVGLGPPVRLEEWEKCWEEDRDAEDHPDDNKPQDQM